MALHIFSNRKGDTMKTIGLIGGMSWESTMTYYQVINETIKKELGGLHSAKLLLYSVDFAEIEKYQAAGDWEKSGQVLAAAAEQLVRAGAECIVICTNTMHKVAPQIAEKVDVPILHIAEATARKLREQCVDTVALLGTKYTITQDFYKDKLAQAGIRVLIPNEAEVEVVNDVIYKELCLGILRQESRKTLQKIVEKLAGQGAQGVVLGCTEIGLLIGQDDVPVPVFDTTLIHAGEAALWSLQ